MKTDQGQGTAGTDEARAQTDEARAQMTSLKTVLSEQVTPGHLYDPMEDRPGWVQCYACGHLCRIPPGRDGICRVRFNREGTLFVPDGYVGALQCDPVEKKPFFHALPGSLALSFGMLGCDYHCGYCQNWITSQALRDPASLAPPIATSPEELVELAKHHGAPILASTYNEPLITSEWAVKVFTHAKKAGLVCAYISNGNATPRVLDYLRPWVDLYKVDLKGFDAKRYHELGGVLQTVLETIVNLKQRDFWVEVVTLIVPGFNDSDEELTGIARFLAGVDRNIPWHVTAFHTDYKMTDRPDTSVDTLLRAAEIGRAAGLHFVYAGNRPGSVGKFENTACPQCGASLIERIGYTVLANHIREGRCPQCTTVIPGVWSRPGLT